MKVKETWDDNDFEKMGWHDSPIYSISFPYQDFKLTFDIDYIFEWIYDQETNRYNFWISPCELTFFDVINLKIDIEINASIGVEISDILRRDPKPLNNNLTSWQYEIVTDRGSIIFAATGYRQMIHKQPVLTDAQMLGRHEQGQ